MFGKMLLEYFLFFPSLLICFLIAGLSTLVGLLKHEDEAIVGNAALCLSHLTDLPKVPAKLTKTNIIQVSVLYRGDIASRYVHRKFNLMFTLSSDKDQRKNHFRIRLVSV